MRFTIALLGAILLAAITTLRAAEEPVPAVPDKLVVLTFDDSCASHARTVAPLLKKHGFGATFFITEGFDFVRDKESYMTWEEIKELHEAGFEIGNHTRRHRGVAGLAPDQLRAEVTHIEERCKEHGIPRPTSFCYPAYRFSKGAIALLRERGYLLARAGGDEAFEPKKHDPLALPQAFDGKPERTLEDFKAAVAKARDGKIAVLTFHGVPDGPHPWVSTSLEKFESYLAHLAEEKCKVVALRDVAKYLPETAPAPEAAEPSAFDWPAATDAFQKSLAGGTLTPAEQTLLDEARKRRQAGERPARVTPPDDPTREDGTADRSLKSTNAVPAEASPVHELEVPAAGNRGMTIAYRVPPGDGSFPAILFFHGGMAQVQPAKLKSEALTNRVRNEFLRRGFVAVSATYRRYPDEPRSRAPIEDAAAMVKAVAALPMVDPKSVAVYGGSGGGSICLELASEPDLPLAAIVAGEPATVIYTGMLENYAQRFEVMDEEVSGYTEEIKSRTEEKLAKITRPILIHHGDVHPLKFINNKHIFPAIEAAGKDLTVEIYPGENHGFYWANGITPEHFEKLMTTTLEFLGGHIEVKPARWTP